MLARGQKVTLVGPIPELKFHLPNAMLKAKMRNEVRDFSVPYAAFAERQAATFDLLSRLDAIPGVRAVYPHKALCDDSKCRTTHNGLPLYFDDDHLGSFGTKAIESTLADALNASASFNSVQTQ
jgi:hypothetical protein